MPSSELGECRERMLQFVWINACEGKQKTEGGRNRKKYEDEVKDESWVEGFTSLTFLTMIT